MAASIAMQRHHRPPRHPTAASRPRAVREQRATSAFRAKVDAANNDSICGASSSGVGRKTMRQIIASNAYCVPIFQRRYCWGEAQWKTLLNDVLRRRSIQHSLGRLTCTSLDENLHGENDTLLAGIEGRSIILDGQQRFTTVTILLSAIRDLMKEQSIDREEGHNEFIQQINSLLFTDQIQMKTWLDDPDTQLGEGIELSFARLIPTYCDRWSYYEAILPGITNESKFNSHVSSTWHRPLKAKDYFMDKQRVCSSTTAALTSLLRGVLDSVTMLNFPLDVGQGRMDGTEDLMVVYERLALRDATWCKPQRKTEYMSMGGVDMIRNLLLGSFRDPQDALLFYRDCWLILEKRTAKESCGKSLKQVLEEFLDAQKSHEMEDSEDKKLAEPGVVGGQLYADFQAWFDKKQSADSIVGGHSCAW